MRFNINHAAENESQEPRRHKIQPEVSGAALRPPEGVPVASLRSVCFRIDILETGHGPSRRKRKRQLESTGVSTTSSPMPRLDHSGGKHRQPATTYSPHSSTLTVRTVSDREEIQSMIDGAFRLSVCGSFSKRSKRSLKVKASTFELGLADIAPVMWRPGYLPVGELIP